METVPFGFDLQKPRALEVVYESKGDKRTLGTWQRQEGGMGPHTTPVLRKQNSEK